MWKSNIFEQWQCKYCWFWVFIGFKVVTYVLSSGNTNSFPYLLVSYGRITCFLTLDFTMAFDSLSRTFISIINHIPLRIKALTWKLKHVKRNKEKSCNTYFLWATRPGMWNTECKESATNPILFSILFNCLRKQIKNTCFRFANNIKENRNRKQKRELGYISNMKV